MENGIECTQAMCQNELNRCTSDEACRIVFDAIATKEATIGTTYRLSSDDYMSVRGNSFALTVYKCGVNAGCPNLEVDLSSQPSVSKYTNAVKVMQVSGDAGSAGGVGNAGGAGNAGDAGSAGGVGNAGDAGNAGASDCVDAAAPVS